MSRPLSVLLCAALAASPCPGAGLAGLERSVVRIVNFSQRGDWSAPWNATRVVETSGSGFVIDGGFVMTNAHVVSDSRFLVLQVHNDPEPVQAEIVHIGHDCDLALVRPVEPDRLEGLPRLAFGGLPHLGTTVDTLGYPVGGVQVSSTRGVVSRIEEQLYLHSGVDVHVAVQTDAAINPGTSGGPVIQDGQVVGVAFQANVALENVGFFIPVEVIERFLRDVEDGRYDGYPELGVDTAGMEQPAARDQAGMTEEESGVRVFRVYPGSSADGRIEVGDILLSVNGHAIANDGTVADGEGRASFGMLIDRMFIGETASLRVLRGGRRLDLPVPLAAFPSKGRGHVYDEVPRYFVYGGLVFVGLSRELMKTHGEFWGHEAPRTLLDAYLYRPLLEPELLTQERVVLLQRLDHPVNVEMAWHRNQVVERVNGRKITSLEGLVRAFEDHEGDFHELEFAHGRRFGVLDRVKAETANAEILERYGIPRDRNL